MKYRLFRIILGLAAFLAAFLLKTENQWIKFACYALVYLIVGIDVIYSAFRNIVKGRVFDENFLMSIATIGAFFIGEYPEAVAVMLFYQVGELFQDYAVDKSKRSISSLMELRPDYANLKVGDQVVKIPPENVKIGDIIVIKAGEKVPLDSVILEGSSSVDTSALTGESLPKEVGTGDELLSGCINMNGLLTARVTKEFKESTVSRILDLVENSSKKKSTSEQFITKFAKYYTPIVVIVAFFLAITPPLVIEGQQFEDWIYRALSFLVVSCPCALVMSIPLSFFVGIGGASRKGILVKGGNYLEALANTDTIVFDKTGTLTKGVFEVQKVQPNSMDKEEFLELAALAESSSNHPISLSIRRAFGKELDLKRVTEIEEIPGFGISAKVDGRHILAGNWRLMQNKNITYPELSEEGTLVHIAIDGAYEGYILIADEIRHDSSKAIKDLKSSGVKQMVMLTGDVNRVAHKVSKELNIDETYSELLPLDKVNRLEELMSGKTSKGKTAFVGDGINDAPVLARADIGIAMGGLGSDAAIEAADIVIMNDEPSKIPVAMKIAKKTIIIANQNIVFSIAIKVGVLILSALGIATMREAIFADVGVTVLAVLNAFRAASVNTK